MQIQAGIYCRISDDQQDGWGVGDQEKHGRRLAEQMGWSVAEVYADNDITATGRTKKRRKSYDRLVSDIRAGRIGAVIATETSRLHRRPLEWYQFRDLAEPHKVKIKTLSDYIDLETGEGVFAANLRAAIDEEEAEQIRRRTLRKHLSNAQAGKPHFGGRTFGYRRVGTYEYVIVPEEAEQIQEASRRIVHGETVYGVCVDWKRRGIRSFKGNFWAPTALRDSLRRPALAGLRVHHTAGVVEGKWDPILDRDEWERLQLVLNDPARLNTGRVQPRTYLLTGLAYCGREGCHQRLHGGTREDGNRGYVCKKAPGFAGCGGLRRKASLVDEEVTRRLLYRLDNPKFRARLTATGDDTADAKDRDEVKRCNSKLVQLGDDYADDKIDRPEYLRLKARVEASKDKAQRRRAHRMQNSVLASLGDDPAQKAWTDHPGLDWRRALIAAAIDEIIIHPQRGRNFNPEAIEVLWKDRRRSG
jgi:site-specific DNA recombinase